MESSRGYMYFWYSTIVNCTSIVIDCLADTTSQFKLTSKTTNALIKRLDKDHDGIVSEAEFMEFVLPRDSIHYTTLNQTKRQSIIVHVINYMHKEYQRNYESLCDVV